MELLLPFTHVLLVSLSVGGVGVLAGTLQTTGFDFSLGFSFNCRTINWLQWFFILMEITSFPNKNHGTF